MKRLFLHTFQDYADDRSSSVAAELTVTSLLALVPLTTVVFALIAFIPDFDEHIAQLQSSFFNYFVPSTGEVVKQYINEFVEKAKNLSGVGILALIVTALLMMRTINQSFNKIWRAKRQKSVIRTFLVYWAVLSLGPLLLGSSLLITTYIKSLFMLSGLEHSQSLSVILPFLLALMTFTLMYYVIPNTRVKFLDACIAGLFTTILFELAKLGFGVFVARFSTYQMIFGAVAVVPLFLIWVYVSWSIILLGAHLCHSLGLCTLDNHSTPQIDISKTHHPFIAILRLLVLFANYQKKGELLTKDRIDSRLGSDDQWLNRLIKNNVIIRNEEGEYCLVQSSDGIKYQTVYELSEASLPTLKQVNESDLPEKTKLGLSQLISSISLKLNDCLVIQDHQD